MTFSKIDLDRIKSKILLSSEIEKKTKVIKKGKDFWCCCPFHDEKTPSCKINDDLGSYYCFGCGAKGDIFSLYTDLYNYSFFDSVKELSDKAGIKINFKDRDASIKQSNIFKILELSTQWFEKNLNDQSDNPCLNYLKKRNLQKKTINFFRLGYSYNSQTSLYNFLKKNSFQDDEIIQSNLVKFDQNKKIKDFFYKRLIFPITDLNGRVVGFGGRVLDNSNPKYINSTESSFFKKRYLLYNLKSAKEAARKKNNLLICEGYMDVIMLHQSGIKSIVAPLGTSLTEDQLNLAWRYSKKPTIMFDGDAAGIRASYKTAVMALPYLTPSKFLQFILLPNNSDPDSFLNSNSFNELVNILKKPIKLIDFIFQHSSNTIDLSNIDEKIMFDQYLDEIVSKINDKKIQYFYKTELKSLFFKKLKGGKKNINKSFFPSKSFSLIETQIHSFFASIINHQNISKDIIDELKQANFINENHFKLLEFLENNLPNNYDISKLLENCRDKDCKQILDKSLKKKVTQIFPYSNSKNDTQETLKEIQESIKNLNTRLSNLKKINKSLDTFVNEANSLNWDELQTINQEIQKDQDIK